MSHSMGSLRITAAARSKAWALFACSNTGVMGSNLIQGKDAYSVQVAALQLADPPSKSPTDCLQGVAIK
jgi:hypothetical protein